METTVTANSSISVSISQRLDSLLARPIVAPLALAVIALAAHGFEIFGFHLTIDEELHAASPSVFSAWLSQGRWGMALLSTLLPNSVTPVVSTALGVGLMCASIWLLLVRHVELDRTLALFVSGVAVTLPTLAFTLSFTTLAYGFGAGSMGVCLFAYALSGEKNFAGVAAASVVGAFVIAVYQPLLVALVGVAWLEGFRAANRRPWLGFGAGVAAILGASVLYYLIDLGIRAATGTELRYVEQFIDIGGLLHDPLTRLSATFFRNVDLFGLSEARFGLEFPGLGIFVMVALALSLRWQQAQDRLQRYGRPAAALGLAALVLLADALPAGGAPLRSLAHLPFVLAMAAAWATKDLRAWPRLAFGALALWCMIGNAVLCNRLYASAALASQRDMHMAQTIIAQASRLRPAGSQEKPLRLELIGMRQWPQSMLTPKREHLGASFFEWDGGNRFRVANLLTAQGMTTFGLLEPDRAPFVAMSKEMPAWPMPGSMRVVDDVLILKLGDYTYQQRRKLCAHVDPSFCSP